MPWYRCLIRGENYPGNLIGKTGLVGFYVNRFVEAPDPIQAEEIALAGLRSERRLSLPADTTYQVAPALYIEEVVEVPFSKVSPHPQGFTWFIEEVLA